MYIVGQRIHGKLPSRHPAESKSMAHPKKNVVLKFFDDSAAKLALVELTW